MTQILFTVNEDITASRLNQATQGFKFLRRTTYSGSAGSPVGNSGVVFAPNWVPGSGTSAIFVRVCGAGGGTPAFTGTANTSCVAGGAGGGGYAEKWILSGFGAFQNVQLGLGGNNTFAAGGKGGPSALGSLISATGGDPGLSVLNNVGTVFVSGGLGGIGSLGNINLAGNPGGHGVIFANNTPASGAGGMSAFGGAGGLIVTVTNPGQPGGMFGGGGSGASVVGAAFVNGGKGAPGLVDIWEYA